MSIRVDLSALHQHYIDAGSRESKTDGYLRELASYSQRDIPFDIERAALRRRLMWHFSMQGLPLLYIAV